MKNLKNILITLLITILLMSCADNKTIDGVEYRPYGMINEKTCKNDSIEYQVAGDAFLSGILFSELLFIPTVYTFGYNIYEPVMKKSDLLYNKGVVK